MSTTDNGGPAFPMVELNRSTGHVCDQHFGLSVRDYFAAQALNASLMDADASRSTAEQHAKWSYQMADAMLAERAK